MRTGRASKIEHKLVQIASEFSGKTPVVKLVESVYTSSILLAKLSNLIRK